MMRSKTQLCARIAASRQRVLVGLVCLCAFVAPGFAAGQNDFIVLSPSRDNSPQTASQTDPHASAVHRLLDCIFRDMGLGYQIAPMPARRAEIMFDSGIASAILDTYQGQLPDLPSYAAPIMPQEWGWFFTSGSGLRPDDVNFPDTARIAVPGQYGLQQHMTEIGFRSVAEASDITQLAQMLHFGRVNAVLVPTAAFREAVRNLGIAEDAFRSEDQATWHLVVRFRDDYATAHPDVVTGFARARAACEAR